MPKRRASESRPETPPEISASPLFDGDAGERFTVADLLELPPPFQGETKELFRPPEEGKVRKSPLYRLRDDALFDSNDQYGFPALREDMLSEVIPTMTWDGGTPPPPGEIALFTWGRFSIVNPPEYAKGGVLSFFTNDDRFEAIWNRHVQTMEYLHDFGWGAVIEPDFSVWFDDPMVVQMFNHYRSRWCARYWQEVGVKIIPNLGWWHPSCYEWAWTSIPERPPVVAVDCRTTSLPEERDMWINSVNRGVEEVEPGAVVIYGDGRKWIEGKLLDGPKYVFVPSWIREFRRRATKSKERTGTVIPKAPRWGTPVRG